MKMSEMPTITKVVDMLLFLKITFLKVPSYGIDWPKEFIDAYGHFSELHFTQFGEVDLLIKREKVTVEPIQLVVDRAYFTLIQLCITKIKKIKEKSELQYRIPLVLQMHKLSFLTNKLK